jgi:hypothetical protein
MYLKDLYVKDEDIWRYVDYIAFKMYCSRLQEESGWAVDVPFAKAALDELLLEQSAKVVELSAAMPKVPIYKERMKPTRFYNKDGEYSKFAVDWIQFCTEQGLDPLEDREEPIKIVIGYEDPNPNSPEQVKAWLFSLGWKPQTFKQTKSKATGIVREVPQVNLDKSGGICPSIKLLFAKEPRLEVLEGLSILNHRIGILKGILNNLDHGVVMAQIQGLTNTLRFKHTTVVNLPKVDKPYAASIRSSFKARENRILCGSDMASLEDRIKQHFIYPLDPDYVDSMNSEDFDPHLIVAMLAGMLTPKEVDNYDKKNPNPRIKKIRDIAKNGNYACQYGAGIPRLMVTCDIDRAAATKLYNAYWKLNWAVKKVASMQTIKTVHQQMWLKNPVNGFYYSLRNQKDVFSTLVQGTGSYVFDMWVKNILERRPQLTAQFHDEIVLEIKDGFEDHCERLIYKAIEDLNDEIKLNRRLDVEVKFGKNYGEIH